MTKDILQSTLQRIQPLNPEWLAKAQTRLDQLTKPRGSLGRLEELAAWYVAVREELLPTIRKKVVVIFAGDHGVVAEGVSAYPQEVTFQMVANFVQGGAGINVLSRHVGAEVQVVDIGVNHDFTGMPGLITRKVAPGTRNLAREAAMSREEASRGHCLRYRVGPGKHRGRGRRPGHRGNGHWQHHAGGSPGRGLYAVSRRQRSPAGGPGWMTRGIGAKSR